MMKRRLNLVVVLLREPELVLDTEHSELGLGQLGLSSDQFQTGDALTAPHTPAGHQLLGLFHHLGLGEGPVDTDDPASHHGVVDVVHGAESCLWCLHGDKPVPLTSHFIVDDLDGLHSTKRPEQSHQVHLSVVEGNVGDVEPFKHFAIFFLLLSNYRGKEVTVVFFHPQPRSEGDELLQKSTGWRRQAGAGAGERSEDLAIVPGPALGRECGGVYVEQRHAGSGVFHHEIGRTATWTMTFNHASL